MTVTLGQSRTRPFAAVLYRVPLFVEALPGNAALAGLAGARS